MTTFQIVAGVLFVLTLAAAYGKQLASFVPKFVAKAGGVEVQQSIAVPLVNDILAVTELRDRLAAEGCEDGVEACTTLLRVIVEYKQPTKGVV
jgi:hypothetical protein